MHDPRRPLFSIGVTTYRRGEMIRETLGSISAQSFRDFEVIIGNDYTGEALTAEGLGVHGDSRFRVLNHSQNLGELGNMNALLAAAWGEYFTWLADDDLYAPNFLEALAQGLREKPGLECAFTGFDVFTENIGHFGDAEKQQSFEGHARLLSGREFLSGWFSGRYPVIGTCGVYKTDCLKEFGGAAKLSESQFALFSEYFLLVQCGTLEQVFLDPRPLVHYRFHSESWGCSNIEVEQYRAASEALLLRSLQLLAHPLVRPDFGKNLKHLIRISLGYFVSKVSMSERRHPVMREVSAISRQLMYRLDGAGDLALRKEGRRALAAGLARVAWPIVKAKVKGILPRILLRQLAQVQR